MNFELLFTDTAKSQYKELLHNKSQAKKLKAVQKTLGLMQVNLRHPGLSTHKYQTLSQKYGIEVFEAYVENKTPGAYRIFWHYGPDQKQITIIAITSHP